jgi:hypothetical protein
MDLQSIAPATKTVPLGSGAVEITGLSIRKLTQLVLRFPDLLVFAAGQMDLPALMAAAPDAMLAVFAVGFVAPVKPRFWEFWKRFRDEAAILGAFDAAPTGQQIDILTRMFEITFAGESARPFLAGVLKMIRAPETGQDRPETSAPNTPDSSTASSAMDTG